VKLKPIFSSALAKKLIRQDFIVKDIQPNEAIPDRTVFYFEDTKELKEQLKKYTHR